MNESPTLWQKAKAFVSKPFWQGLAKGALLGVPTAVVVWSVFGLIPTALMTPEVLGFIGLQTQFLFCTVFGAAGAAVTGGVQAVADLNHQSGLAPKAPALTALTAHDVNELRDASPTLTSDRIKEILAAGPKGSHQEDALASRSNAAAPTLH